MRLKLGLLATVFAVSIPYAASADTFNFSSIENTFDNVASNAYVGLAGDWNIQRSDKLKGADGDQTVNFDDGGWGIHGTVGTTFLTDFREEFEVAYRKGLVDNIHGTPYSGSGNGADNTWTFMFNTIYDWHNPTRFTPYIGAGIGIASVQYVHVGPLGTDLGTVHDNDWAFAYQGLAGVNYKIDNHFSVGLGYEFLGTAREGYSAETPTTNSHFRTNYTTNSVLASVTYAFNAPHVVAQAEAAPAPAPVEAAPAPAPIAIPNSYMVFFDWNQATITPEGQQVLKNAVDNAHTQNVTHIDVTGHADRSGTAAYNMKLSRRRAVNVKAALVKLGLPASEIAIHAKGETDPLVPTADGVREPQNRRVEIVYGQ